MHVYGDCWRLFKKKQRCPKVDKWPPPGQTKEAVRPQAVAVLWKEMEVVAMKKIQSCFW
jgi:hypothetical protein